MRTFISHKQDDRAVYTLICNLLDTTPGIERWDPEKMTRGESLHEQLRDAIRRCDICIFVATRRSIESPWCLAELGAFWGAGKRVLMYMADPDLAESSLPPQFRSDLRVSSAQELVDALRGAIDAPMASGKDSTTEIVVLDDRMHLYKKTAEILRGAKRTFNDTTWGPWPRKLSASARDALEIYLAERNRACARGVACRELFAGPGRESRIKSAKKDCEVGNLEIKVIKPTTKLPYMPDFAVVDTEHVIISNVCLHQPGKHQFVYARSEGLAQLLDDWYLECWRELPGKVIGRPPDGYVKQNPAHHLATSSEREPHAQEVPPNKTG